MRLQIMTAAAALMALTACSGQGAVKAPDSVDGLTKAQVEAIVKEYLMREPIVLAEAFGELQRREEEMKVAATDAERPMIVDAQNVLKNWPRWPDSSSLQAVRLGSKSTKGR